MSIIEFRNCNLEELKQRVFRPIVEKVNVYVEPEYDHMPTTFTSPANWPLMCNLHCWACDRTHDSYPKFIPVSITKDGADEVYEVYGHFCSWPCVLGFLERDFKRDVKYWDIKKLVEFVMAAFKEAPGTPAPPKYIQRKYCGPHGVSEEDYMQHLV